MKKKFREVTYFEGKVVLNHSSLGGESKLVCLFWFETTVA